MPATIPNPFDPFEEKEGACDLIMGKPSQQLTSGQVKEVICRHDPMALLKMGAPGDEYDSEVAEIVHRRNQLNSDLGAKEIKVIFEYWFMPECITLQEATRISLDLQALFMRK